MSRPTLVVFASGTKNGGGSGFENLVINSRGEHPALDADIVAVVSNHELGGVRNRAEQLGVPFIHMPQPYTGEAYKKVIQESGAEWVALSGWLKKIEGMDAQKTFNIHPGPLHDLGGIFGGTGMYGHFVHEAVRRAFHEGKLTTGAVSMHFVTEQYDEGPVFFEHRVQLNTAMTPDDVGRAVNEVEHEWQPRITNMVVHGEIAWDGHNAETLCVPHGYQFLPKHA